MRGLSNLGPRRLSYWAVASGSVLITAFLLRLTIVLRGGQQFWPDEDRFEGARQAARHLLAGETLAALRVTFASPEHILFRILAIFPALLEVHFQAAPWLPGICFAAVSTAMLWSIGRLAIAAGGSDMEQCFVLMVGLSCASLFYYSRHFFPYDLSLLFFLSAGSLAVSPQSIILAILPCWSLGGLRVSRLQRVLDACGGDWGPISGVCHERPTLPWHPRRIFGRVHIAEPFDPWDCEVFGRRSAKFIHGIFEIRCAGRFRPRMASYR